eukprot:1001598-Prymnesium_polylepis.2
MVSLVWERLESLRSLFRSLKNLTRTKHCLVRNSLRREIGVKRPPFLRRPEPRRNSARCRALYRASELGTELSLRLGTRLQHQLGSERSRSNGRGAIDSKSQ